MRFLGKLPRLDRRTEISAVAVLSTILALQLVIDNLPPDGVSAVPVSIERIERLSGKNDVGRDTVIHLSDQANAKRIAVLLSFKHDCAWCTYYAPVWAEWLDQISENPNVQVIGITRDDWETGVAYAAEQDWKAMEILSVRHRPSNSIERRLTIRTPWLTVVAADGSLLYTGHGSDVDAIEVP